ncbi:MULTISPECIES: ABC transporter permease [unclassified Mucilaginibacter]|uniref:ABC transporter permease n=1 Tax=unclassified Mucilaginibacter TaxID=2617802 RepID=UPI002AC9DE8E|nr:MULTISPECIES: ABC transporter permease [unclassified Mucilaginibacter]MEB0260648.1 ABC transporter permease [Mucilaginibacter sp. 10I4]MEB0277467.1 ABC transporter permease [Mucilaginibacter sp. 10B2]MEB0302334.1 ABC transporter permease [Mucilaginibacter sp. 5C4]WPX24903.1 ABC transporter permease [Mucilaginibacter sp. 5C4]
MTEPDEYWDLEIKPKSSLFDLKLKDVWSYRDLLLLLVRRDFVSFYKQTVLGPVWFFVQPVITIIVYNLIFSNLAGIKTDDIPGPVFYLAGTIIWNYFAECLTKTSTVFKDNSAMLGKVYFPRLIMPLSIVFSNLIRFGVQLILFVVLLLYYMLSGYHIAPNIYIALFPFLILMIAALGLGLGMIISAATTKYRDLAFVVSFGVPLLMYTTTVIYPLSEVIKKYPAYSWLIKFNPLTAVIETCRYGFLGKGAFSWDLLLYSSAVTIVILFTGIVIFNKVEKTFVDTV